MKPRADAHRTSLPAISGTRRWPTALKTAPILRILTGKLGILKGVVSKSARFFLTRIALAASLAIGVTGCGHARAKATRVRVASSPAPIPTALAKVTSVAPTLTISGIVAPFENVAISTSLSEPTLAVYVNEGDNVRKGELLALLDTSDLQATLAAQEATARSAAVKIDQTRYQAQLSYEQSPDQVTQARASLRSAQSTLAQGRLDLARYNALVTQGFVSNQQFAQQETTVQTDEAAVRSAEAALSSAQTNQSVNGTPARGLQASNVAASIADAASARAQIRQIEAQIARARIVSPVDGVVVNRNLNAGEYPGSRTSFTVQEISRVYASLNASSADVFRLHAGSPARIVAGDDASGRTYNGHVYAVLGQVQPGATNFTVKVLVDNPDGTLQAGIPVTATIALGASRGIGIPTAAFLDDTNSSVYVVRDGVARTARVHLVASDGTTSIVTGLAPATAVIANGQLGVTPGQRIARAPTP